MCLYNNIDEVKAILSKPNKTVICWKILKKRYMSLHRQRGEIYLTSPFRCSTVWNAGTTKSNSKSTSFSKRGILGRGIHVFRDIKFANNYLENNIIGYPALYPTLYVIVKVTANRSDLIGANDKEMLFRKVNLSEKEYKKAIKDERN